MKLILVTIDQNSSIPGNSTAYSAVLTLILPEQPLPLYLTQYVGYCGSSKAEECAQNIVAGTTEQAEEMIRLFKAAIEAQKK